jgi:hypothetical protein
VQKLSVADGIAAARTVFPVCWFDRERTSALLIFRFRRRLCPDASGHLARPSPLDYGFRNHRLRRLGSDREIPESIRPVARPIVQRLPCRMIVHLHLAVAVMPQRPDPFFRTAPSRDGRFSRSMSIMPLRAVCLRAPAPAHPRPFVGICDPRTRFLRHVFVQRAHHCHRTHV